MKNTIILFLLALSLFACNNTPKRAEEKAMVFGAAIVYKSYYLAPTGKDNNSGTVTSPWLNLTKAWTSLQPGDTLYLRGGTYSWTSSQYLSGKNGTASAPIHIFNYPGEIPILTSGSNYSGNDLIEWAGNYIHWKGLEIANFKGNSSFSAFRSENCNNCIFELINYHHNPLGFTIRNCNNNLVLNSDFHHNEDGAGDNADGLNITYVSAGSYTNTVRGCRAWNNSDDGFDYWANDGNVLTENCWSWHNGYAQNETTARGDGSGFKMGQYMGGTTSTLKRTVKNCIAANNRLWGFNENHCLTGIDLINNTAYNNGNQSYWFGDWGNHKMNVTNNIHYLAPSGYQLNGSQIIQTNNSWQNNRTVSSSDFVSLDATQLLRARKADGSLPDITFLQLAAGSDLAGLGYTGSTVTPPPVVYTSSKSGTFIRNNCPANTTAGSATYTATATSTVSQADADAKATADVNTNGQNYANTNATCTPVTVPGDTTFCQRIVFALSTNQNLRQQTVTYFVKRANGLLYDNNGAERNIIIYRQNNVWKFL